jgi:hypothetical protein
VEKRLPESRGFGSKQVARAGNADCTTRADAAVAALQAEKAPA